MLGDCNKETTELAYDYGKNVGIAFQVRIHKCRLHIRKKIKAIGFLELNVYSKVLLLCRLQSIEAHRDHFVQRLSVCLSVW